MRDHAVELTNGEPVLAPRFNAAVPFIDRHRQAEQADRTALLTAQGTISYGELAAKVNQCGNALQALPLAAGERLLMIVKDCPEFVYLFWGAIKIGVVPVPIQRFKLRELAC